MEAYRKNNHIILTGSDKIFNDYSLCEFPNIITNMIIDDELPEGIILSYLVGDDTQVDLHITEFNVVDLNNKSLIFAVSGNKRDFNIIKKYLHKNYKMNYIIKPYSEDLKYDILLEITYGKNGNFTIWNLTSNTAVYNGRIKNDKDN